MGFSVHFTIDGVSLKPIVPQDDVTLCIWFSSKTYLPPQIKPTPPRPLLVHHCFIKSNGSVPSVDSPLLSFIGTYCSKSKT